MANTKLIRNFRGFNTVLCEDGRYRYFPILLIEELQRAFGGVETKKRNEGPLPGIVQILDPLKISAKPHKRRTYIIEWPNLSPRPAMLAVRALMKYLGIPLVLKFTEVPGGFWHLRMHVWQWGLDVPMSEMPIEKRRECKYPWDKLNTEKEIVVQCTDKTARTSFAGWKEVRQLDWRIRTYTYRENNLPYTVVTRVDLDNTDDAT
jgi:hypothetical protein